MRLADWAVALALLNKGAMVDVQDAVSHTAVHFATADPDVLMKFRDRGADLNREDRSGCTPLHWACDLGMVTR